MSTSQATRARIKSTVRLAGSRLSATKSGKRGRVTVRLRSRSRVASGRRVVVRVTVAGRSARTTVGLDKRTKVALKSRR
jgi:hypothetical protein